MTTKTNTKTTMLELDEALLPDEQRKAIAAFVAANPKATIRPISDVLGKGGYPAYLNSHTTKRAKICAMFSSPITWGEFKLAAKANGGGLEDLRAALVGGYSNRGGVACVTLNAS